MIQQLPTEIISSIFQELAVDSKWMHYADVPEDEEFRRACSNLVSLCQTSRRLRSIAEPLLYQTYIKPNTIKVPLQSKNIHGYLQTLLQRPDLARCVRNMCIKAWFQPGTLEHLLTDHDPEFWQWQGLDRFPREPFLDDGTFAAFLNPEPSHDSQASPQLLTLCREHLERLTLTDQKRRSWYRALEDGQEDAEITLLLSLTTNLDHLFLIMPNWEYFERPSSLPHFTEIIGTNLFLRNLTSICVRSNRTGESFHELDDYHLEYYQGFPFSFLLPFLALPSLRSADTRHAFELNILEELAPTRSLSSSLRKLELQCCAVHPRVLHDVMTRCTGLENFVCDMPESDWPIYELSKALYVQRSSLKSIHLSLFTWGWNDVETDYRDEWAATDDYYAKSFGFLVDYPALKHLTICENMILQFSPDPRIDELLPSGLETLHLTVCTASLLTSLEALLGRVQSRAAMPDFSKIRISNWNPDPNSQHTRHDRNESTSERQARKKDNKARMRRLCDGFNAVGIACSFDYRWAKRDGS